jgi:hypothetical protein
VRIKIPRSTLCLVSSYAMPLLQLPSLKFTDLLGVITVPGIYTVGKRGCTGQGLSGQYVTGRAMRKSPPAVPSPQPLHWFCRTLQTTDQVALVFVQLLQAFHQSLSGAVMPLQPGSRDYCSEHNHNTAHSDYRVTGQSQPYYDMKMLSSGLEAWSTGSLG